MDAIDNELKLVRLQRERMALERELALRAGLTKASTFARNGIALPWAVACGLAKSIRSFIRRWWRFAAIVAILGATAACVWQWRAKVAAAEREAKMAKFVEGRCPASAIQNAPPPNQRDSVPASALFVDSIERSRRSLEYFSCKIDAESDFNASEKSE